MAHDLALLQISKAKLAQFNAKGIETIEDLAHFFPRKYIDFRKITSVLYAKVGEQCAMEGIVQEFRCGGGRYSAIVEEGTALPNGFHPQFIVIWFGTDYHINQLQIGQKYVFCGKVSEYMGQLQINSPIAFGPAKKVCKIQPFYSKIKGMSNEYLLKQIDASLNFLRANDKGGEKALFASVLNLMPLHLALAQMHHPTDDVLFKKAMTRLNFETIYDFYADLKEKDLYLIGNQVTQANSSMQVMKTINGLPFTLTEDQMNTIMAIIAEIQAGRRLHSLVSGDVGCGKTMIAILSSIFMWENGLQTIVMAPTLVLARQHLMEFEKVCSPLGIQIALLSSETKKVERKKILARFKSGEVSILIGTHSVLSTDIEPDNLGMTIIDEEHKFGVRQKAILTDCDKAGVHHLSMTATPIPRSIAMTLYGRSLAVLPIQTKPKGRKAIISRQCFKYEDAFNTVAEEIKKGHQAYIICPFIEDSESERFQNVVSVAAAKKMANDYFGNAARIGVISGDMKQADIINTVAAFEAKQFDILISTTIVEVGVNIPNATVIVIMSADRFGLAGLHQLRGRVGRGSDQSYCLLCSSVQSKRLDIMCSTSDGFEIAEQDLILRGPGDLTGEEQSGASKVIDVIIKHPKLTAVIRKKLFGSPT